MSQFLSLMISSDPLLVFSILLLIILIAPLLFNRFKIPGIIGLILAGVLIGPKGLGLVSMNDGIQMLSGAGVMYLMFLAGLELNIQGFKRSRKYSIVFGILTFFVPLTMGFATSYWLLGYDFLPSLLMASMFSTHTLISYPIVSRLGITRTRPVTMTIGGTIITDTAVLLLLVVISALAKGYMESLFWIKLGLVLAVLIIYNFWLLPRISSWVFRKLETDSSTQFIFVLVAFFLSGLLSKVGGIEPIIGAFLTGLSLSSLIPHTSALMNRVVFVGNAFFIPIFLVSVGMLVDIRILGTSFEALKFSAIMIVIALTSKWIAAFLTQKIYKLHKIERDVIYGLSVSHAAAIIAVALVGYQLKLIDANVLNGAILIILFSCLISTIITEKAGKKMAIIESGNIHDEPVKPEKILVPVANPATVERLVDLSLLLREKRATSPVYMLSVIPDDEFTEQQIKHNNKAFESVIQHAAASETKVSVITRVDLNIASGIIRAVKEMLITKIIIGWNGHITTTDFFFGSLLEKLVRQTEQQIMVSKLDTPFNNIKRLVVFAPENAEAEVGCQEWLNTILIIAERISANVLIVGNDKTTRRIKTIALKINSLLQVDVEIKNWWNKLEKMGQLLTENDLSFFISARENTLSYHAALNLYHLPRALARYFENNSFIIVYPEQQMVDEENISLNLDGRNLVPGIRNLRPLRRNTEK